MDEVKAHVRNEFQKHRRMLETIKRFEKLPVNKQRRHKKKMRDLLVAGEDQMARNLVKELEGDRKL